LPEPDFTSDPLYTVEPREVVENFHGDYVAPNDISLASMEITTLWRNRVLQGTSETCLYYYEGEVGSDCVFDDWRNHPPTETRFTNGVQKATYSLWEFDLNDMPMRYANNITGYGPTDEGCWVEGGLGPWSYSCSDEFWVTATNGGSINYVYEVVAGIYPHELGGPFECTWTFWPKSTNYATITVGGHPASTDGYAYFALQEGIPYNLTPRDSSLNYYAYEPPWFHKYQAPSSQYFVSSGVLEPDYDYGYGRIKTGPNGFGYDANKLEIAITNNAGTQWMGTPSTNRFGEIRILSEVGFQVPVIINFNNGWSWHQDAAVELDVFDPLQNTNRVYPFGRKGFTPNAPSANGNDDPDPQIADTTLDIGRYIYTADSPGLVMSDTFFSLWHKGTIFSLRFAARTWPTWNGSMVSPIVGWHMTLTVKLTSDQGVRPATAKVINSGTSVGPGATKTPMTVQEAWGYYNQP